MSIVQSLKSIATVAVVLSVPVFAVWGLMASSVPSTQLAADFHLIEPVPSYSDSEKVGGLNTVEVQSFGYTYGGKPTPIPVSK